MSTKKESKKKLSKDDVIFNSFIVVLNHHKELKADLLWIKLIIFTTLSSLLISHATTYFEITGNNIKAPVIGSLVMMTMGVLCIKLQRYYEGVFTKEQEERRDKCIEMLQRLKQGD